MLRTVCKSKLHGAIVTEANVHYTGSLTLDADLMKAADLVPYEQVHVVDVENGAVDGLFVGETNPLLVEGSRAVSVPYRWIQSVGDVVILRYFPKRVTAKKAAPVIAAK
jgi:aspartate 1-decarboxylase